MLVSRLASLFNLELLQEAKSGLISVGDIKEAVWVTLLLVDLRHQGVSLKQVLTVHKEIQRVLLRQLYSLTDDVVKVISSQIIGDKVPKKSGQLKQI